MCHEFDDLGDDGSLDPALEATLIPGRLRRHMEVHTTTGPYLNLVILGLKESEVCEIRDLLIARGWLAG